jgi:hypothetical protein
MAKKVTIDNLQDAISDILEEYAGDIQSNVDAVTRKIGQKGVQALKSETKTAFPDGKKYATGWTYTAYKERLYTTVVIHNKKQAGLAHLLEHGHVTANGTGRHEVKHSVKGVLPDGKEHILPVEEKLIAEYEREVIQAL